MYDTIPTRKLTGNAVQANNDYFKYDYFGFTEAGQVSMKTGWGASCVNKTLVLIQL